MSGILIIGTKLGADEDHGFINDVTFIDALDLDGIMLVILHEVEDKDSRPLTTCFCNSASEELGGTESNIPLKEESAGTTPSYGMNREKNFSYTY